jgi:trehalose synthase
MVTGDDRAKGGVFEILRTILPYVDGAGIETGWLDLPTPPEARSALEFLHVLGHDAAPNGDWQASLARHELALSRFAESGADEIRSKLRSDDLVVLHDTQTAPLCAVLPRSHAVVWHAHIGTRSRGPAFTAYWDLLGPAISEAALRIFYLAEYVPDYITGPCDLIPPAVDPSTTKAAPVGRSAARSQLRAAAADSGLVHQVGGARSSVGDRATLAVQVSRWDPLKDMAGVMELFALAAAEDPALTGLVVGTAAQSASEIAELKRCVAVRDAQPPGIVDRLHIWSVQASGTPAHDGVIRAVQSAADVLVQKSLQEGYGLTVTEAMLRGRPVVASDVGGISAQITDGVNGLLVPAPYGPNEALGPLRAACGDDASTATLASHARAEALRAGCVDRQLRQLCAALERTAVRAAR